MLTVLTHSFPTRRSSDLCTNDSASQSTCCSSAKAKSLRSFSVSAASGTTTSGTLTPLRSEILPPTSTMVSIRSGETLFTRRTSLPSSIRSRVSRSEEHTSELQSLMRTSYAVFCQKQKHQPLTPSSHDNNSY